MERAPVDVPTRPYSLCLRRYLRGEGVAGVVLKRMADVAVVDAAHDGGRSASIFKATKWRGISVDVGLKAMCPKWKCSARNFGTSDHPIFSTAAKGYQGGTRFLDGIQSLGGTLGVN